jgi:ribosomal protein L35
MKTNKSFSKRLRVSKNGKIVARATGQNHFNAKKSGGQRQKGRRAASFTMTQENRSRFLSK